MMDCLQNGILIYLTSVKLFNMFMLLAVSKSQSHMGLFKLDVTENSSFSLCTINIREKNPTSESFHGSSS